MKNKSFIFSLIVLAIIALFPAMAKAVYVTEYGVIKYETNWQTGAGTYASEVYYFFEGDFECVDATSGDLDVPTSPATNYTLLDDPEEPDLLYHDEDFSGAGAKAAMNVKYPNGDYTFNITFGADDPAYTVNLAGDFSDQVPEFVSGGVMPFDTVSTLTPTFNWTQWTSSPGDFLYLEIIDMDEDDDIFDVLLNDVTATLYTLDPGYLEWGKNYAVMIGFVDASTYYKGEDSEHYAAYITATGMQFNTVVPEPTTMLLLGSLATGLFSVAGARRKRS